MTTEPRMPETRANVAAWVTYAEALSPEDRGDWMRIAARLSNEECVAHIRSCNPELLAPTPSCPIFEPEPTCPLCAAISRFNDIQWTALPCTRNMPVFRGDKKYAREECFQNTADKLSRRHAAHLIAKHTAAGTLDELAALVVARIGYEDDVTAAAIRHAADDVENYATALEAIASAMLFSGTNNAARSYDPIPLRFSRYATFPARRGWVNFSQFIARMVLQVVLALLRPKLEVAVLTALQRARNGNVRHVCIIRLTLLCRVVITPRAPQPCPGSGIPMAVVA